MAVSMISMISDFHAEEPKVGMGEDLGAVRKEVDMGEKGRLRGAEEVLDKEVLLKDRSKLQFMLAVFGVSAERCALLCFGFRLDLNWKL